MQFEALRLFVERANDVNQNFALTPQNASAVIGICKRLDGLPLAIELAAARAKGLSLDEIAKHLDDRFRLLSVGSRSGLPRHQTLRAAVDWSYDLLSPQERALFRQLSVFAGGFTLQAAQDVCGENKGDSSNILDALSHLVDKSVVAADHIGEDLRYHLLETLRQYAHEKLAEVGGVDAVRARHLDYFLQWAEEAEAHMRGRDQFAWFDRFETEHENIRAALDWCQASADRADSGLRLTALAAIFWQMHGYHTEGRTRLTAALAQQGAQQRTRTRAQALHQASLLAFFQSDYLTVRTLANENLDISKEMGSAGQLGAANALEMLAKAATQTGDYSAVPTLREQALAIFRDVQDEVGIGDSLTMLGWDAMRTGDFERAESRLGEALVVCRHSGDLHLISVALAGLGELAVHKGQYERAGDLLRESLAISRRSGEKWRVAIALGSLGWIAYRQRDFGEVRRLLRDSLDIRLETGDQGGIAWCLEKLAGAASLEGQPIKAIRTFAAAAAMRASIGSVIDSADRADYEHILSGLRRSVREGVFEAAWREGQAIALHDAIEDALQMP